MNRIHYGRVLRGGLLAGGVLAVGEFLLNGFFLSGRWLAALEALGVEPPPPWSMVVYVIMTFVLGIAIVWLYAAVRPRFGPGPGTASLAGLFVWFLIWVWSFAGAAVWGLFPSDLVMIAVIWGLVEVVLAALAGGWVYQEDSDA